MIRSTRSWRIRISFALTTAVCIVAMTIARGSPFPDSRSQPLDPNRDQTLHLLDDAVRRLFAPSANYVKVLNEALSALPSADGNVARDLRAFLARTPKPGPAFKCSADFLRQRARRVAMSAAEAVRHGRSQPIEADVCYAAPAALDLTGLAPRSVVDVYGFDLDTVKPELVLVEEDGSRDVSTALKVVSHDHLVIDVDRVRASFTPKSLSLAVTWGHLIHYSVPLVRETTRLCESRVETIPPATVTYPATRRGPVSAIGVSLALEYSLNRLDATMCVVGADPEIDGCSTAFIQTIDPDFVIEGILSPVRGRIDLTRADWVAGTSKAGDGVVERWELSGHGTDPEREGLIDARLKEVHVVSAKDYGCISPITYLDARRTHRFAPHTRRALDGQLKMVDTRILKMRPRFARRGN